MLSNTDQSAIGRLNLDGDEIPWQRNGGYLDRLGPEDMFDEGNSLDLSPVKLPGSGSQSNETTGLGLATQFGHSLDVEDTFQFRRQGRTAT